MDEDVLFEEVQQFSGRWLHTFFLVITGLLLVGGVTASLLRTAAAKESGEGLLAGTAVTGLASLLLGSLKLVTRIGKEGISVRYAPFQRSFTQWRWKDIDHVFIRKYNPLLEYGGWGMRWSRNGRAYNVSGNMGIQIVFRDGTRFLIGTNCPEEAQAVLRHLRRLSQPME